VPNLGLTPIEAVSALARRRVAGELSARAFAVSDSRLRTDRDRWELVAVSAALLRTAEEVVRDRGIKALDAVHFASALMFQSDSRIRIPFNSADERPLGAAAACGLRVERA